MASLRSFSGSWYARVQWWLNKSRKDKLIPLKTKRKVTAMQRIAEVNKVEEYIKQGIKFNFPWMTESPNTNVKQFSIGEATKQWMKGRVRQIAKKTMESNQNSIDYFVSITGSKKPLESITTKDIKIFSDVLKDKGLSVATVNIHLRTIKTMFRYYLKVEILNRIPLIEQISTREKNPIYITDNEFQHVMELDWLDDFYKRVFFLYRETGMRLREPMISTLEGDWIDIPNLSKGKRVRSLELNDTLKDIFKELKNWSDNGYGSELRDSGGHISKYFKKALIEIGANDSKHFHSLRHTYAVRTLIQGTSIYELKLMMGHNSVTTTEIYSNMNLKRVSQDFPTLISKYVNEAKIGKEDIVSEDILGLPTAYIT